MEFGIFITWFVLSIIAGVIAANKARSGIGFFFLAIILSPLIGILAALIAKENTEEIEKQKINSGSSKKCPFCAEVIKIEASVCRYCGKELPEVKNEEPIIEIKKEQKIALSYQEQSELTKQLNETINQNMEGILESLKSLGAFNDGNIKEIPKKYTNPIKASYLNEAAKITNEQIEALIGKGYFKGYNHNGELYLDLA